MLRTLHLGNPGLFETLNDLRPLPALVLEIRDERTGAVDYRNVGRELIVRGETFDPVSGEVETSRAFYANAKSLDVELPVDADADNLRLFHEDGQGGLVDLAFTLGPYVRAEGALIGQPTLSTIVATGPSTNRVDIVLIGDGYAAADMALWRDDANAIARDFFQVQPFTQYKPYFNVHRIDAISTESGVDHPESGVRRNTAFDASYNCGNIQRLVCVDIPAVRAAVGALLPASAMDMVLVVVNDPMHGGSGNIEQAVAVTSMNVNYLDLLHHELGHSFAGLTDEYVDPAVVAPANCNPLVDPVAANGSALHGSRQAIKWGHWISASTELPTAVTSDAGPPGLYAGGAYCANLYRPTPNSKMRTLNRPFEAVNEEQIVLTIYRHLRPIESYTPAVSREIVLDSDPVPRFSASVMQPASHALEVQWYLDGALISSAPTLAAAAIPSGRHTLELIVIDPTPKVLKDANNRLSQRIGWIVQGLSQARFADGVANLPAVSAPNGVYNASLALDPQTGLFVVEHLARIAGTAPSLAATFADGRLEIPSIAANGRHFRAVLDVASVSPSLRFRLVSATPL